MMRFALSLSLMALLFSGAQANAQVLQNDFAARGGVNGSLYRGTNSGYVAPAYYQSYSAPAPTYAAYYAPEPEYVVPRSAALINLEVPANAEVWFSGQKTTSTGTDRSFVTPSLESGRHFAYDIRVRWTENGKAMEKVQKVRVHPGDRLNLQID